ncbi:hypothetical protein B188_17690 [Candidatus Brocadiaceae bacterium B188]|nr:MAG: hypothetical protein IPI25_00665 [Candidatus Brocadia sp.]TWU53787.1 hypothetical protein B188_17690 [Candidatus Brocadiaceae bacterium B188]
MKKYSTKRGKKTIENQGGDEGEGFNGTRVAVASLTFMKKLLFRQRVRKAVHKERGANARYRMFDVCTRLS